MKPTCQPTARDREFAADLYAVLCRLAREGKPIPTTDAPRQPRRPKVTREAKKPRRA